MRSRFSFNECFGKQKQRGRIGKYSWKFFCQFRASQPNPRACSWGRKPVSVTSFSGKQYCTIHWKYFPHLIILQNYSAFSKHFISTYHSKEAVNLHFFLTFWFIIYFKDEISWSVTLITDNITEMTPTLYKCLRLYNGDTHVFSYTYIPRVWDKRLDLLTNFIVLYLSFSIRILLHLMEFRFVEPTKSLSSIAINDVIGSTLSRMWETCCRGWRSRTSARSCLPSRWCTRRCVEDSLQSRQWMKFIQIHSFFPVSEAKPLYFLTWLASTYLELDSSAFFFSRDLVVNSGNV